MCRILHGLKKNKLELLLLIACSMVVSSHAFAFEECASELYHSNNVFGVYGNPFYVDFQNDNLDVIEINIPPSFMAVGGTYEYKGEAFSAESENFVTLGIKSEQIYASDGDFSQVYDIKTLNRYISMPEEVTIKPNTYHDIVLKVDEDVVVGLPPSRPVIKSPLVSFERRGFFAPCNPDDSFSFSLDYTQSLSDFRPIALIQYAETEEELESSENIIWAEHVDSDLSINLNAREEFYSPFCITVQLIDLAGQISERSEPLCIDTYDPNSPFLDSPNPRAPGCACSSVSSSSSTPTSSLLALALLLLLGFARAFHKRIASLSDVENARV